MENLENNKQNDTKNEILKKGGVLLGIFALLIILIVATIVLVPKGLSTLATVSFTSIFTPKEKIIVKAEKPNVISGDIINLSWNGPTHADGSYTITYPCKDGIVATFHSSELMTCDTAFYFATNDNSVSFVLNSSINFDVDIPIYINYKDNQGKTSLVGDVLITIKKIGTTSVVVPITPPKATSTPVVVAPKPIATSSVPVKKPIPTPTKPITQSANLEIKLVAIGSVNVSNVFTAGTQVNAGERPAVRFEISNTGTISTGGWTFKARTPSPTTPLYQSNIQSSLGAGQKVQFTLGFDNTQNDGQVIISVNEDKLATESNYSDNILNYTAKGTATGAVSATSIGKDLTARITAVGYMDASGSFVAAQNIPVTARGAFKFIVTNIGKDTSGAFIWTATLPSTTDKTYTSKGQTSLNSGDSIEYTLAFNNIANKGNNTVTINIDSDNSVSESNEANNTASAIVVAY